MSKYLIKFCKKPEYAKTLFEGKLYCNPAFYYRYVESQSGDVMEASIFHGLGIYKNDGAYIYCTFLLDDNSITSETINHFGCEDGYVVIIKYEEFQQILESRLLIASKGYASKRGLVKYANLGIKAFEKALSPENEIDHLFVKRKRFEIEHEYRIVFYDSCNVGRYDPKKDDVSRIYNLGISLADISKIIEVKELMCNKKMITSEDIDSLFR